VSLTNKFVIKSLWKIVWVVICPMQLKIVKCDFEKVCEL
jgi:hypothetical protein